MGGEKTGRRRCATYTRKSSEEGLEQDFNSLDAQREACEAYIKSQAGEGWKPVKTRYDDGGFSGGNVDRPGLQQLLADIDNGKIDIVVVYKVDRLTRSLADFAKIVEVLDVHKVSFVSVTQQFNTTTSMGRLTLNMLLSFAQFEREVTGERIRDKIAASKRKGLWMGGLVPLGYEADGRTLKIVEAEAMIVRRLFQLYLELGTVKRVKEEADRLGFRSKVRELKDGSHRGGLPLGRGHIHRILNNPIYVGQIGHKGTVHEGQHQPIIDRKTWDGVQKQLANQTPNRPAQNIAESHSPLRGKLFDEDGGMLTPSHTVKSGRRYRYYVSRESTAIEKDGANRKAGARWRLPARDLERCVERGVIEFLSDPAELVDAARQVGVNRAEAASLVRQVPERPTHSLELVRCVVLGADGLILDIDLSSILSRDVDVIRRSIAARFRKRGVEQRLVLERPERRSVATDVDPALLRAIARAHRWFQELSDGRVRSLEEVGEKEGISARFVGALMPLAFLCPDAVSSVSAGEQPVDLTTESLIRRTEISLSWSEQRRSLALRHQDRDARG
ncbi:MAG: recombinase family protein [bacterium]|nr:recombinase family protein [bacterium]